MREARTLQRHQRLGLLIGGFACWPCMAATWLDSLYLTFDTPLQSSAGLVTRQKILQTQYGAAPQIVVPGLPPTVGIAALTLNASAILYTPDISFTLNSSLVTPRDVVQYASGTSSVYLSGSTLGLPANVKIDALALSGSDVLFSVNAQAVISGAPVGPADVLRWNGSAVSVLYSAQSLGLPPNSNLTALEHFSSGNLLMGFDTAGKVGGVTYRAGEILEYAPSMNSWALVRNQSQLGVICNPCRTRDIAAIADPDEIFRNGLDLYEN